LRELGQGQKMAYFHCLTRLFNMKVKRIDIGEFRCFRDLQLELTYPAGHPKAGEPLDKVCIIGQSGTGKTSLLELVYLLNARKSEGQHSLVLELTHTSQLKLKLTPELVCQVNRYDEPPQVQSEAIREALEKQDWNLIYFPAEAVETHVHLMPPEETVATDRVEEKLLTYGRVKESAQLREVERILHSRRHDTHPNFLHHYITARSQFDYWNRILGEIANHQNEQSKFRFRISNRVEQGDMQAAQAIAQELEQWKAAHPDQLSQLAEQYLNPLLRPLHMRVKTALESLEEAAYLQIIDARGSTMSINAWTTGTKNLILKTVPLFALKPTERDIILIDEPENSLFPDVQAELIEHYRRLAPDSQLFVATHSPIVASYFEPWEVIDLEFDSKGRVMRNTHLIDSQGEWHVDNFAYHPKWLSYEGIYRRYFDFEQSGNPERDAKLTEAAYLKSRARHLQEEGKADEAKIIFEQYKALASKLR